MNTQDEYQTAFRIASDYLQFSENCASQGQRAGKLSGNETHFVQQRLYDLSGQEANLIDHPFYDEWKCLQTKAGKKRVAAQLQFIAKNLLFTFKDKYPHFYAQVTGSPKIVQPLANIALNTQTEYKIKNRYTGERLTRNKGQLAWSHHARGLVFKTRKAAEKIANNFPQEAVVYQLEA
jgi:hypothetical protein